MVRLYPSSGLEAERESMARVVIEGAAEAAAQAEAEAAALAEQHQLW